MAPSSLNMCNLTWLHFYRGSAWLPRLSHAQCWSVLANLMPSSLLPCSSCACLVCCCCVQLKEIYTNKQIHKVLWGETKKKHLKNTAKHCIICLQMSTSPGLLFERFERSFVRQIYLLSPKVSSILRVFSRRGRKLWGVGFSLGPAWPASRFGRPPFITCASISGEKKWLAKRLYVYGV